MGLLKIVKRNGDEVTASTSDGLSVMEIIRNNGIDEMLALCGGCQSCATCHVFVEPQYFDDLPPMSDDEDMLLDGSSYRGPYSRLSCQLPFVAKLDGLKVTLAPED